MDFPNSGHGDRCGAQCGCARGSLPRDDLVRSGRGVSRHCNGEHGTAGLVGGGRADGGSDAGGNNARGGKRGRGSVGRAEGKRGGSHSIGNVGRGGAVLLDHVEVHSDALGQPGRSGGDGLRARGRDALRGCSNCRGVEMVSACFDLRDGGLSGRPGDYPVGGAEALVRSEPGGSGRSAVGDQDRGGKNWGHNVGRGHGEGNEGLVGIARVV